VKSLYRTLLRLYPASFRAEYGGEMEAVFADRQRRASGLRSRLGLWGSAALDVVANAPRAHMDILGQDLRHTARSLARTPGFTATAVLVSALGIGAAAGAFSITDHVLIRKLPFPESERLMVVWESMPLRGFTSMDVSPANFRDWKRLATSFEGMGAYRNYSANLVGDGEPQRVENAIVTADLFSVLRARPALGRLFSADDDRPGAAGVVLLSDHIWRERFGADPEVLGKKLLLDGEPHEVVGILPRGFLFPKRKTDIWTPFRFAESAYEDRNDTFLTVVARLKPGVSVEAAHSEMTLVAARLERAFPKENEKISADVYPLKDDISEQARLLLKALFGASVGVLLIACLNLANLQLARSLARRAELSVRSALGAGRDRLVRQLLTESLVLAFIGGVLGVAIAVSAGPLFARLIPHTLPIAETPPVDLRMLSFAVLLTAATGVAFGVLPARRACAEADASGLAEGARAGTSRRTERLRSVLVVVEVTASVALLIATGLLLRALWRVRSVDPGFRSEGVLTLRTSLPMPKYLKTPPRERLYTEVLSGVRRIPGVESAAYISFLPIAMRGGIWPIAMEGVPEESADNQMASLRLVTPEFFATLGIPLRLGRDVRDSDRPDALRVAVVSESFARGYWPGENPLGKRFRVAAQIRTIVGVAGDVRVRGLERESEPQVYLPFLQAGEDDISPAYAPKDLVVRSSLPPATLLPSIRSIVTAADSSLPVSDVRPLAEIVEGDTAPRSVQARVLGAFAAAALILAGVGIHGVLAFAVSQRTREIGVRIALGAPSRQILEMVLRRGVALAAAGAVLGATLALGAGRIMQGLLAGIGPADPAAFVAAAVLALAMTVAGSLVPALRAVRVDPVLAMRAE
jgi:putative ABC transport system permease protein